MAKYGQTIDANHSVTIFWISYCLDLYIISVQNNDYQLETKTMIRRGANRVAAFRLCSTWNTCCSSLTELYEFMNKKQSISGTLFWPLFFFFFFFSYVSGHSSILKTFIRNVGGVFGETKLVTEVYRKALHHSSLFSHVHSLGCFLYHLHHTLLHAYIY